MAISDLPEEIHEIGHRHSWRISIGAGMFSPQSDRFLASKIAPDDSTLQKR